MKKCYTIITISLPTIKIFWEKKKKGLPFVRRKIAEYRKKEKNEIECFIGIRLWKKVDRKENRIEDYRLRMADRLKETENDRSKEIEIDRFNETDNDRREKI